jgi:hypothetical protein
MWTTSFSIHRIDLHYTVVVQMIVVVYILVVLVPAVSFCRFSKLLNMLHVFADS